MPDTGLIRDYPKVMQVLAINIGYLLSFFVKNIKSLKTSGENLAYLITDKSLENTSGKYFEGKKMINSSEESYNESKAKELYEESVKLLKMDKDLVIA